MKLTIVCRNWFNFVCDTLGTDITARKEAGTRILKLFSGYFIECYSKYQEIYSKLEIFSLEERNSERKDNG